MKIEIILVLALALVFIIDYLVRKKGKNSTKEIKDLKAVTGYVTKWINDCEFNLVF